MSGARFITTLRLSLFATIVSTSAFASPPAVDDMLELAAEVALFPQFGGPPPLQQDLTSTLFLPIPTTINVAPVPDSADSAQITDLRVADFDRDGRNDLCVAWFVTDYENPANNHRTLSFWWGTGRPQMQRGPDIDLFIPDPNLESLSVFRNGSSQIGLGDFDGDGDADLAVLPFFGEEIWFLENLGNRQFAPHLKFTFGFNTTGNFQTPPEAGAADFDGDGREDLVYIADPIQHIQGLPVHFWRTDSNIASMERVEWLGLIGGAYMSYTRSLAVADFDGDGHPDLAMSGSTNPTAEDQPVIGFWYGLNPWDQTFFAASEVFPFQVADLVPIRGSASCRAGLVASDAAGSRISSWANVCSSFPNVFWVQTTNGFVASSPNRGMALEVGDLNGDGEPDIVARQYLGDDFQSRRVEIALGQPGGQSFVLLSPSPINTTGFGETDNNPILRPHNLAIADLFGNRLPEIIAGFGVLPSTVASNRVLRVAVWANSCEGDIDRNGVVDISDLSLLLRSMGVWGDASYWPEADLDRDGRIDLTDISILLASFGCNIAPE